MDSNLRKEQIQIITLNDDSVIGNVDVFWKDNLKSFPVYNIPLRAVVYNPYNGRIASQIKSLERHRGYSLELNNDEHQKIIESFIWNSKIDRNKKTYEDLNEKGQERHATITKDGVLIDGNRRAMLLNKLKKTYIKTIILPVTLEEDPIAIQELEYQYQIAVDEKVEYNSIEKYIKAFDLYNRYKDLAVNEEKILTDLAKLNGFSSSQKGKVKDLLQVYSLMTEYLTFIEAEGYLVLLDKKEDLLLRLYSWMTSFIDENGKNKESKKGFEGYSENDVFDLKDLAFDYIQAEFEGKKFRNIATGNKGAHIFSDKELWKSFFKKHGEIVANNYKEVILDPTSDTYIDELKSRSQKFKTTHTELFNNNLDNHEFELTSKKREAKPSHNIEQIKNYLEDYNLKKQLNQPEVVNEIKEIREKLSQLFTTKPLGQLQQIKSIFLNIDIDYLNENEMTEFRDLLNYINKASFDLRKKI